MSMFSREPEQSVVTEERRPRRWRFWLVVVGLPLLIALLTGVGWIASANSGLQAIVAELDAADPNWRLEDLERTRYTPPPGQNAADRVLAVAKALPKSNWPNLKQDELLGQLSPPALLNEQQTAAVQAIVAGAGPTALAEARKLIDTPRGRHAIQFSPDFIGTILKCQDNRQAVSLLRYDALERAQAGDLGGAVAACHAGFHAGCSIGDEPLLISQLVRVACQAVALNMLERVLAQGEPPADRLAALQARLEAEEPAPLLLYGARGERAGGNQLFEHFRNDPGSVTTLRGLMPGVGGGAGLDFLPWLMRLPSFLTTQQTGLLRYTTELIEIAKRPTEEWADALATQRAQMASLPILTRLLAPAMDKVAEACQRNHAMMRNAIVALAAERFRQQHGRWPAALAELVKAGLLKAAPTDPFDGKPLRFKRTANGLVVYCVGLDKTDDGGTIDRRNPVKNGTDMAFQLWDVTARRQPAPPPKLAEPSDAGPVPGQPGDDTPPGAPPKP